MIQSLRAVGDVRDCSKLVCACVWCVCGVCGVGGVGIYKISRRRAYWEGRASC